MLHKYGSVQGFVEVSPQEGVTLEPLDLEKFVYFRCRAIEADVPNGNGDYFPKEELIKAYKSFIGKPLDVNHNTQEVVGSVIDACFIEDGDHSYVECLAKIDRSLPIAEKVVKGIINKCSMSCIVQSSTCNVCGHTIYSDDDPKCEHLKSGLLKEYQAQVDIPEVGIKKGSSVKCFAINKGITFTGLSLVNVPAWNDADVLQILASLKQRKDSLSKEIVSKLKEIVESLDESSKREVQACICPTSSLSCEDQTKKEVNNMSYVAILRKEANLEDSVWEIFDDKREKVLEIPVKIWGSSLRKLSSYILSSEYGKRLEEAIKKYGFEAVRNVFANKIRDYEKAHEEIRKKHEALERQVEKTKEMIEKKEVPVRELEKIKHPEGYELAEDTKYMKEHQKVRKPLEELEKKVEKTKEEIVTQYKVSQQLEGVEPSETTPKTEEPVEKVEEVEKKVEEKEEEIFTKEELIECIEESLSLLEDMFKDNEKILEAIDTMYDQLDALVDLISEEGEKIEEEVEKKYGELKDEKVVAKEEKEKKKEEKEKKKEEKKLEKEKKKEEKLEVPKSEVKVTPEEIAKFFKTSVSKILSFKERCPECYEKISALVRKSQLELSEEPVLESLVDKLSSSYSELERVIEDYKMRAKEMPEKASELVDEVLEKLVSFAESILSIREELKEKVEKIEKPEEVKETKPETTEEVEEVEEVKTEVKEEAKPEEVSPETELEVESEKKRKAPTIAWEALWEACDRDFEKCVQKLKDEPFLKVEPGETREDAAARYCAWLHKKMEGVWPREKKSSLEKQAVEIRYRKISGPALEDEIVREFPDEASAPIEIRLADGSIYRKAGFEHETQIEKELEAISTQKAIEEKSKFVKQVISQLAERDLVEVDENRVQELVQQGYGLLEARRKVYDESLKKTYKDLMRMDESSLQSFASLVSRLKRGEVKRASQYLNTFIHEEPETSGLEERVKKIFESMD